MLRALAWPLPAALPDSQLSHSKLSSSSSSSSNPAQHTLTRAQQLFNYTQSLRRQLHAQPELLYDLGATADVVKAQLDTLRVTYTHSVAKTGIVATIGTGKPPCVALRADMDALPIDEQLDSPYKSRTPNKMHACGHDAHTAMLLTAARILKEREAQIPGTVKLIFQPAEEGGAGGLAMLQAGVLEQEPRIESIYALHVWPGLDAGVVATRPGTIMAAAGFYHARFLGHGGHAAMPHTTVDPFSCVAAALPALQTVVSRNVAPTEAGVVSTTFVRGGSAYNIIPTEVELGGTIRSLTRPGYRMMDERVAEILRAAAAVGGCELELTASSLEEDCMAQPIPPGAPGSCTFPPTVNARGAYRLARAAAVSLIGESSVHEAAPTMGGEDFSYFLEKVPGAISFLGIGNSSLGTNVNLHNPRFQMDESQMPLGAALHVETALRALTSPRIPQGPCEEDSEGLAQCAEGTNLESED